MHLKRLEIQGFKSFPERTKLDLTKGITTVVGPNGSGKSNISDAVRWALGEQSAKTLRGGKMEDIIFAGTQNRRAQQFAEVSLILDNEDKKIPMEFDEIKVTRRVYRSGEGEYILNGVNCRLKDIHELFMDTGIGKEGYSIIGQGRIDEILSVKSSDRRLLFEEATGIVKFKNRKNEAEIKLEKEKQNLMRVEDIINEIESQLDPLHKQSDTAKKFLSLSERLKLVQVNIFLYEATGSEEKIIALASKVEDLKISTTENTEKKEDAKNKLSALKTKYEEQININKEYSGELIKYRSEIEKKENDIKIYREKISHIDKDTARLHQDIEKKQADLTSKATVKEGFQKHRISLADKLNELNSSLTGYQADFDLLSDALQESENKLNAFNQRIYEKMAEISDNKSKLDKQNIHYSQLESKKEQLNEENVNNDEKVAIISDKKKILGEKLNAAKKESLEIDNKCRFYDEEIAALKKSETDKTEELNDILKKYNSSKTRLKLLKELEESYEGYYKSVKTILTRKKQYPEKYSAVLGAVGSLLNVSSGYETAIEIALGGYIQNIVTETEYDTKEAIAYLKENRLGRATFLPLSAIKPKDIGGIREKLTLEQGFLGIAKELITYDAKYENIFSNILGRVIIVDNFDNALKIFKKYNYAYKIVTVEGELLNTGGAITGGAQESSGVKIFGRGKEIASLTVQTEELRAVREKYEVLLESIKEKQRNAKLKNAALHEELQKINISIAATSQEIVQADNILTELISRRDAIKKEDADLLNEIIETNKDIRYTTVEIESLERELMEIREGLKIYQTELSESRQEKDIKIKILTDLKIELASISEKLQTTDDNIKRLEDESSVRLLEIEKSENEIGVLLHKKLDIEESVEITRTEIEDFKLTLEETSHCLTESESLIGEYSENIAELEITIEDITQTISSLTNELTRQTLRMEQAQEEIRKLYDLMWDEYEITYNTAKEYERIQMSARELQSEERAIKSNIRSLGNVNVGAIEEYREKKDRYDFLSLQRTDILEAEESLKKLIKELTALMEEQFREQLTVISSNFKVVFSEMFGGGSAEIMLTDEGNILESGIELIAQPPGKKLSIMSLLSGGERSLTAMALLFAILRMKPSPFCVLDEIDAALDDANVTRFTNYMKNFSYDTQFILITHKKGTMVAADALYGVTMQEQGVSKLVSVNLKDA